MQIYILYEELCCTLSYLDQTQRLCNSYLLLNSVNIWSRSDDYIK